MAFPQLMRCARGGKIMALFQEVVTSPKARIVADAVTHLSQDRERTGNWSSPPYGSRSAARKSGSAGEILAPRTYMIGAMPRLDLPDDEVAALGRELVDITGNSRFHLSPRIQTLTAILAKLRSEPARPAPPTYHSENFSEPVPLSPGQSRR
jgi:hypothetical protein